MITYNIYLPWTDLQVDIAGNVQPEKVEDIWNLRGILNTSWHRIQVQVTDSSSFN
jgi:hypothetical protein